MSYVVTANVLRAMNQDELQQKLQEFHNMCLAARQRKAQQGGKSEDLKIMRKNITRCMQVIREKKLEAYIKEFKGKKFIPKELRPKLNRALRRKLTPEQVQKRLKYGRNKDINGRYPMKVFSFVN